MKFSKLTLAIATTLSASVSFSAFAMELYVDTKTKQIYAEPGRGRELMGSFQKVDDAPVKAAPAAQAAELAAIKQDLELKTNEIKALSEHAAEATKPDAVTVKLDDGIHFATRDGNFTAGINGRLQVDSQSNINQQLPVGYLGPNQQGMPAELDNGATLRRARLGIEGTFFKATDYKFEYDFTRGNGLNAGGITDAYIRYNFSKPFSLKFGAFKEPFSMEEATSNRYLTFIERNMVVNTLVDNLNTYKVGIGANYSADRWLIASSLQTEGVGGYNAYGNNSLTGSTGSAINTNGGVNRNGGGGDTTWEVNTRIAGTPWMASKTKFLHVGTSGSYININNNYTGNSQYSNGGVIFANGIGANVDRTSILNTGNLTSGSKTAGNQADYLTRFGAESALVYGPFSAQGEYIQTDVSGRNYDNASMNGYYGYTTYFLTGESRNYKSKTASWDRIKPTRNFDLKGGWGAWEVAGGYDYMNLNSGKIQGGRASTLKAGLNWYPNSHVRVMANYLHALDISTTNVANATSKAFNKADLDMIETRIQLDW
ncbi:OprO/OprP family phosphate-selective porin [Methylobacter psychrophilus]|uniref:OprO/OprP family phosphate-selective porin n=1 Tax=Methylobacter psychrophilus TaxID=96941 RepID=UPI0021D506DB|nr:porin [Methylobacter psychrophilus]